MAYRCDKDKVIFDNLECLTGYLSISPFAQQETVSWMMFMEMNTVLKIGYERNLWQATTK